MKAILLVGGLGTRLRPLTTNRPKALMPVLNRPFISYQLDLLKKAGVTEVVFAAGHLSERIREIFPLYSRKNFVLRFAREPRPLGTGGGIRFGYGKLSSWADKSEPLFILNGDVLIDIDLNRLLGFHRSNKSQCTIAVKKVEDPTNFGVVEFKA